MARSKNTNTEEQIVVEQPTINEAVVEQPVEKKEPKQEVKKVVGPKVCVF